MAKLTKEELRASAIDKRKVRIDLTVDEYAAYKGVSKSTVERLYKNFDDPNKLKATYLGGIVRLTWDNIEEFDRTHSQNSILFLLRQTDDDLSKWFDDDGNLA